MIGRQVFTYCAAFLLTGDPSYLEPASVGTRWLLQNAWDPSTGGWHALLDAQGAPTGSEPRTAQDAAYAALGLSAWFFITRDPAAEARILDTRDLLLEGALWDPVAGRIRDAVSADHQTYIDIENDGGAELVAQLDAVNAFLLLSQRVLTSEQRRAQFAQDLQLLGEILVRDFFSDGMFWGVHNQQGNYAGRHVDFGHNLKAYWMLLQIDKATATQPFRELLDTHLVNQLSRAFDAVRGRWGKRPTSGSGAELGSDWWIWAECDQLAATVNLQGGTYDAWLSQTAQHWSDFLDTTRPARELIPTIDENGAWVYPWPDNDTAKANQWKNGYHGVEHALIMYLHGHWRADTAATLYFAPLADAGTVTAPPYLWHGSEVARTLGETINLSGAAHTKVTVQYERLF
jgi:mannose/cellobiose epimerase-like protein (N-acyl-D-glucosamine 2-epimerase family)